ncbi:MAG: NADH-quinone oxidoreductase subunit N, partial [Methylobacteriaceae bacterium]|nr:NADH-quinone oxidoreductase subunit N [Methylobacteriaceae bacterium]
MSGFSFVLAHAFPEFLLAIGALLLILLGALRGEKLGWIVDELAIGLLGLAIVATLLSSKASAEIFDGAFIDDRFARFMKILALLGSMIALLMSRDYMRRARLEQFEFPILIVLSTIGMQVLISANSLIALYLGLELMSLALYVVAAFNRDDMRASEAGLKYFVLGALSSGMML